MTLPTRSSTPLQIAPAPWDVHGAALIIVGRLPRSAAHALSGGVRRLIAPPLIGSLAGVGFVRYDQTPVGPYHELAVTPAVHWRDLPGAYISRMVVDSQASWLAGRSIWSLPKEMGSFDWREQGDALTVAVRDAEGGDLVALSARRGRRVPGLYAPLVPVMAVRGPRRVIFGVSGSLGDRHQASVTLDIAPASPLAPLLALLRGPHLVWWCGSFHLRVTQGYDLL